MKKFNITVNGVVYQVEVEEIKEGDSPSVSAAKPRIPLSVKGSASPADSQPVNKPIEVFSEAIIIEAPISGSIHKVNVAEGQEVKEGDVLIILEAMKMENEIIAPVSGEVARVHVNQGEIVQCGEPLISLK